MQIWKAKTAVKHQIPLNPSNASEACVSFILHKQYMVSIETRLRGEKSFHDIRLIFRVHNINPVTLYIPAKDALFAL